MLDRLTQDGPAHLAIAALFLSSAVWAGGLDGALDPSFWGDGTTVHDDPSTWKLVVAPDGKLIGVGNYFVETAWYELGDDAIGPTCQWSWTAMTFPEGAAFDGEGRLLIAGNASEIEVSSQIWVARYLYPDCQLDPSFGSGGVYRTEFETYPLMAPFVRDLAVDSMDRPVFVASSRDDDDSDAFVFRLTADGEPDASFSGDGLVPFTRFGDLELTEVETLPDDRIVVAGWINAISDTMVARFEENGDLDDSFDDDGIAYFEPTLVSRPTAMLIEPDTGKMVVSTEGSGDSVAIRIEPDGDLDAGFGEDGVFTSSIFPSETVRRVVRQSNGKLLLVGRSEGPGEDNEAFYVYRLTRSGSIDDSFGFFGVQVVDFFPAGNPDAVEIPRAAVLQGGKLVVAGYAVAARLWISLVLADDFESGDLGQWLPSP